MKVKANSRFMRMLVWQRQDSWWSMPFGSFRERIDLYRGRGHRVPPRAQRVSRPPPLGPPVRCSRCDTRATWFYVPTGKDIKTKFYCDGCVHRGCDCTADPETGELWRDYQGRAIPCCEYTYDAAGFWLKRDEFIFRSWVLRPGRPNG